MAKIAVVVDTWFPFVGGGQINAYEVSRRLAKTGFKIDIITRNCGQSNLNLPKNLKVIKLGNPQRVNSSISQTIFCARALFYLLKNDYDLIHAHAFLPGLTARFAMLFKGIPAVFTVHGTALNTTLNGKIKSFIESVILTKTLYSAEISVSRDFLNLPNINKQIVLIPNGVDLSLFKKVKAAKQRFPTLLCVGRLHPQKNQSTLLQSIKIVKESYPDVQLLIVGQGPLFKKLKSLVKVLKLARNVKIITNCSGPELIKLYKSSHLFILPSIYEGQSIALLESWAAKVPVIVSKVGDNPYLVKEGYNGYILEDPTDPKKLFQKIIKALNNKNLEKLGLNGYNLVKNQYSWDQSAIKTGKLYDKILNTKN